MADDLPLDSDLLALTALVTVGVQLTCFLIAYLCQFDKITDLSGTSNFILLAWLTYGVGGQRFTRQTVLTVLVTVWGVRLGSFLFYRVCKRGKDERFDEMRARFFAFLGFWIFQIIWVWTVSLPVIFVNAAQVDAELGVRDYIGWALWAIGFFFEVVADQTKYWHVASKDPNKPPFLRTSVWSVSRHPNYFGEITCWLGIFISASSVFEEPGNTTTAYVSVLSPIVTFLLLTFLSGVPLAEQRSNAKCGALPEYQEYKRVTSPLIPLPTALYGALPHLFKKLCFCEYDMYAAAPESQAFAKT